MSEHNDPLKENQEELPRVDSSDDQTKQQINSLLTAYNAFVVPIFRSPEYNYEQLRAEYEKQANSDVQNCNKRRGYSASKI